MTMQELLQAAEALKADVWTFMEKHKIEHKGLKSVVNEMLDLLDELADERKYK